MSDSLIDRLKRRKVVQWTVAYLAASWLVLQVMDFLAEPFSWPDPVLRISTVLLAVGVLPVLVVAWYHGEKGAQRVSGVELLMLSAVLILAAAAVAIVGPGRGEGGAVVDDPRPSEAVDPNSIAVLPFLNLSGDSEQEYFSDGITEELLNVLARIPRLRVASRTSAFSFKGRNVPVDSIGRALRVAHVLEGSIRRSAGRVRINAQLTDARSGYQLWSESYDRELQDALAMQTEIATEIARVLNVEVVERAAGSAVAASMDPAAYDSYLRGLYSMNALDYGSARSELELAVAREPRLAPAWAVLSDAYNQLGRQDEARSAARRAVQADSTLPGAHAAMAYIDFFYDRDWPSAQQHLEKALTLNPAFVQAIQRRAYVYVAMGRADEAVREIDRAAALDPLSSRIVVDQVIIYFYARRYDLLERHLRQLLTSDPGNQIAPGFLGAAALARGRREEAARWFAEAGDSLYVSLSTGDTARALVMLGEIERSAGQDRAFSLARGYALLGRAGAAFDWLERGVVERERLITLAAVDPFLGSLRSDPRMRDFLDRLGPPWSDWPTAYPPEG